MNRQVRYADPFIVASTKPSTPSMMSRQMKTVTDNSLHLNVAQNSPITDVKVRYNRPSHVSRYDSVSGYPFVFRRRETQFFSDENKTSNKLPNVIKNGIKLDGVDYDNGPDIEYKSEMVEILANGEVVKKDSNVEETVTEVVYDDEAFIEGDGIFDSLKSGISKVADRVIGTTKALFQGQSRLQPPERKIMEQYGDKKITQITLYRAPIKTVPVDRLMAFLSEGAFHKKLQEYGYDRLFHLFMIVKLEDGTEISVEKNETIQMKKSPSKMDAEQLSVNMNGKTVTLNDLMNKTMEFMGSDFFPYNPITNNCQRFISSAIKAIGLNTSAVDTFVNQPVDKIFEIYDKSGKLTTWMTKVTQLGTKINILKRGGKVRRPHN